MAGIAGRKTRLRLYKQKFNRLTVLDFAYIKNKRSYWKCLCDCGNEIISAGSGLKSGNTKSCGCLQKEKAGQIAKQRAKFGFLDGKNNPFYGKKHTEKTKKILAELRIGTTLSEETKKKIGDAERGEKNHNYGKPMSEEQKKRISKSKKGKHVGKNSPHWKSELTEEDRISRKLIPGYKEWVQSVFKLDDCICQNCGDDRGGNFNAHHIESYNSTPELRTETSNGITLCETCHKDFHHQYGYGGNTRAQLIKFLRS